MSPCGLFVTGTDTGAGKSVLAAAVLASLRARGISARALKPVITGLDDVAGPDWPPDHELLGRAAGCPAEDVILNAYGPAVSPHLAAELEARPIDPARLTLAARRLEQQSDVLIVEGVGGLLVPITDDFDVRGLALELRLPLLIAARPGLGTINHTLLTLEAARTVGLEVTAVVLTPWPWNPSIIERSNRATIERLGGVPVAALPRIARPDVGDLAAAGDQLPLDGWLPSLRAIPTAPGATLPACAPPKILLDPIIGCSGTRSPSSRTGPRTRGRS